MLLAFLTKAVIVTSSPVEANVLDDEVTSIIEPASFTTILVLPTMVVPDLTLADTAMVRNDLSAPAVSLAVTAPVESVTEGDATCRVPLLA